MKINPHFDGIIGQEIAKQRLSIGIASAQNDGPAPSPLLIAPFGVGKTLLMQRYGNALEEMGFQVLRFKSPQEFRSKGAEFNSIRDVILGGGKYAILIDEAHEFMSSGATGPTVQTKLIWSFIMKALGQGENKGGLINFDGENFAPFDRTRNVICLATNFPERLDKSGAFQSRCDKIELAEYTREQLVQILQIMMKRNGMQPANPKTLSDIANCGRGSARPMERIVDQLSGILHAGGDGKKTVNREEVHYAMKLSKLFPMGLQPWEIRLLKLCQTPQRHKVIQAVLPAVEPAAFKKAQGFLIGNGLMVMTPSQGLQTSANGNQYLSAIHKQGFVLEEFAA